MTTSIRINTCGPISATIRPPGSKSITNRSMLCAALANGSSTLHGVLDSDDTRLMADALVKLGASFDVDWSKCTARVGGCGGPFPSASKNLFVGNSGTTMRFLTAAVSLSAGRFRLSGTPRMHQRPIGDLINALRQLGVHAQAQSADDCPPVDIESSGWTGGQIDISAETSSQFVSGLMLAAPYSKAPVALRLVGKVISQPYIRMTYDVMSAFGAQVNLSNSLISISNQHRYRGRDFQIEPDATAASYFLAAAAIAGGTVTITGLGRNSSQGDLAFANCLERMGCKLQWSDGDLTLFGPATHGIDIDMGDFSDTVQTLAVVALFVNGPTTIRNVAHIRHKESDRIGDLVSELRKLGAIAVELPDGLRVTPAPLHTGAELDTYDDHRMAMSLSLAGLKIPGVVIRNPECVTKTYPQYFVDLASVTSEPRGTKA